MSDTLKRIEAYKREEIAHRRAACSYEDMANKARDASPVRGFIKALEGKAARDQIGLIAEIKKASPSKGLIREDFNPSDHAQAYEKGGAAGLSVLTDGPSFQGHEDFLIEAREACALPVLRKDFLYDPWQVVETRALGADCILIIMAAVTDDEARRLYNEALKWDLDVLVEIHNEDELDRALPFDEALMGINSRNLRTFETDLGVFDSLAQKVTTGRMLVAESGLFTPQDVSRVKASGAQAILVGESLMRQDDIEAATLQLLSNE